MRKYKRGPKDFLEAVFGDRLHLREEVPDVVVATIVQVVDTLLPFEAQVIKLYYGFLGECRTLQQICFTLEGTTTAKVTGARDKAIRKCRHPTRSDPLRSSFLAVLNWEAKNSEVNEIRIRELIGQQEASRKRSARAG